MCFSLIGDCFKAGQFSNRYINYPRLHNAMAKSNKINMPSSGAGITQYFDDYKSKITFQPIHIIIFAIVVILIELLLWISL